MLEGSLAGANAAFHCRLMKKNEWEKVCRLLELYSDEPPSPVAESKGKGRPHIYLELNDAIQSPSIASRLSNCALQSVSR